MQLGLRWMQLCGQTPDPGHAAAIAGSRNGGSAIVHTTLKQVDLTPASDGDLRCDCGKLLARVLHGVLELKCSRCKSVMLVAGGQRFAPAGAAPCTCGEPSRRPDV
jgi:hypothetical protein